MARRPHLNNLPAHRSIDAASLCSKTLYGHTAPALKVTCRECGKERWYPVRILRQIVKREGFHGVCKTCTPKAREAGYLRYANRNGVLRRTVTRSGYIGIGPTSVSLEDLPLFRRLQAASSTSAKINKHILEHRWVMTKHLGRPLTSDECVDHKDGRTDNNALDNLRIYVRGKQQPGSCPGHGTYYHEWQMAEQRLRALEAATDQPC